MYVLFIEYDFEYYIVNLDVVYVISNDVFFGDIMMVGVSVIWCYYGYENIYNIFVYILVFWLINGDMNYVW